MNVMKNGSQLCPDCARPLQTVGDYPTNELWCLQCGNRYFAAVGPNDVENQDPLLGFRILLVDNISSRRDHLVRHLTRLGYQVTPVCHPRQALEAASFRRFDVTVLPTVLPEFDCSAFVYRLKQQLGTVKFVLITESGELPSGVHDPDVVSANVDMTDDHQLEQTLEQLIDELVATQLHHRSRHQYALMVETP